MTIFELIRADHKKVGSLLEKLEKTTEAQTEKRERLFELMKEALSTHAKSEEEAVYTVLKERDKTRPLGFEGYEEHHLMDELLEGLSNLSPSKETWTAKLSTLRNIVEQHVEEEETEMFKKMKKVFDQRELKEMAISMKELEKTYSTPADRTKDPLGSEVRVH